MTTPQYRDKLNAELPHYRTIHSLRIEKATRILIISQALDYDDLLRRGNGTQWARAELRRKHNDEWREILSQVPGTVRDVRLGLTVDEMRSWPWS